MADLPKVPELLSLESRAQLIADESGRIEHLGNPKGRREHIYDHALAHLRAAVAQDADIPPAEA
jgi:hypothetical protein